MKEHSKEAKQQAAVSAEVPKKYNPLTEEKQWQEFWEKNNILIVKFASSS